MSIKRVTKTACLSALRFIRMRPYSIDRCADANIKACGIWLHVGTDLWGIAPLCWWQSRRGNRWGLSPRFGLEIWTPIHGCGIRTVFELRLWRCRIGWNTRGEATSPAHYRWDETGLQFSLW
jgi:hypothetical protein